MVSKRIIARDMGVTEGDIVLKGMPSRIESEHGNQNADEKIQRKNAAEHHRDAWPKRRLRTKIREEICQWNDDQRHGTNTIILSFAPPSIL